VRRLGELVMSLSAGRGPGVIYATAPWRADSQAIVHDPWSVLPAPRDMAALVDADLAREYLRAWTTWQPGEPGEQALVDALLAFVARPLVRSRTRVPGLALHRATMHSGAVYDDPSEDLLYQLFLDIESGKELFIVVERLNDATGHTYVQALRDQEGAYLVEQRAGDPVTHQGIVTQRMPAAHLAVCDWLFRGRDVTSGRSQRVTR
jgi:hypothetical protein